MEQRGETMTLLADLLAARARIDRPEKWCKGPFRGNRVCALMALNAVSPNYLQAMLTLSDVLPSKFRVKGLVSEYNDHPKTKHADIMALYDRAIGNERYAMCLRGFAS